MSARRSLVIVGALGALGVGGYLAGEAMDSPRPPVAQAPKLGKPVAPPSRSSLDNPTPSPSPTSSAAPTPPPTAKPSSPTVPWTAAECSWAVSVLTEDAALDSAASGRYATGISTPPPGTSGGALGITRYYRDISVDWTHLAGWISTACATGIPLSQAEITAASGWIAAALESHHHDLQVDPGNAAWDDQWIGNYDRISAMLAEG